jgi:multisubunit Na+/H+ antiporter MnhG subunit
MGLENTGKFLIGGAVLLLLVGGLFLLLGRMGLDRLPGDLVFRRGNATVYFPIGLMILLSILGTILLNLFFRR